MNETRQLAQFARGIHYNDLPQKLVSFTQDLILDQLGIELVCATLPWAKATYETVRRLSSAPTESTVVYYGEQLPVGEAAFANATFGHSFDFDDSHPVAKQHPGCVNIPVALAVGEITGASGRGFLEAVIAGYEVNLRVGVAVMPSCLENNFHEVTACGPFGAAAAASKLLGLDEEGTLNALGMAGSHAGGVVEYTQSRGSVKRLHAGIAALGGLRSAFFAQGGITGPIAILEGNRGFCRSFADEYDIAKLTQDLGQRWLIMDTRIKPYPCCGAIHAPIDAVLKMTKEHRLTPDGIAEIIVGYPEAQVRHVGVITEPEDILGAQFSTSYSLALTLFKGNNTFQDYTEENLHDPAIRAYSRRIRAVHAPELDPYWKEHSPTIVTIKTQDGHEYRERVLDPKGSATNPMTSADIEAKFRDLASRALPADRVDAIVQTVRNLGQLASIRELARLLTH